MRSPYTRFSKSTRLQRDEEAIDKDETGDINVINTQDDLKLSIPRAITVKYRKLIRRFYFLILSCCVIESPDLYAEDTLTLWNRNFDTAPVDQVIALALTKTEDLYPKTALLKSPPMEQDAAIDDMLNGSSLDIISAASSIHYDEQFLTLQFPILKGLLGKRLCLIRAGEQSQFMGIKTAYDFTQAQLNICQGSHWPDTEILQRNGLPVVTSEVYQELFTMLEDGRCDCFLRGAQEITPELKIHSPELALEENIVIEYSQPGVVYVRKSNPALATRIELGLLRALEDGSYDRLINRLLGSSLERLRLNQRQHIIINNPSPSETLKAIDRIKAFDQ
ncbi:MAG: hypothetical protein ACRBBW_16630 [Cellvibrionaceae bacterium]